MMSNATLRYFREASLIRCRKSLEREREREKKRFSQKRRRGNVPPSPIL